MGVYVVSGAASGMGRSTADQLRWEGHRVIGVDLMNAEATEDLPTVEGRAAAVEQILEQCGGVWPGRSWPLGSAPSRAGKN